MTKNRTSSGELLITSKMFEDGRFMPIECTGFGSDISPDFHLHNLSDKAVSIAIIMDDLDIPFIPAYNHWLIWNIPNTERIPEHIPHGPEVSGLGNARQGIGYGRNRYRGPKQPVFIRNSHRYVFYFYALDCFLDLESTAKKRELVKAMAGHILQKGSFMGVYKRN